MKFKFSKSSLEHLQTTDIQIQLVIRSTLQLGIMDFAVTCGLRSKAEQNRLFNLPSKPTKLRWPNSKHNSVDGISRAVDIVPFINGKSSYRVEDCCFLAGLVLATAKCLGVKMRWGGNWDRDGEILTDQTFDDLLHFELED